MVKLRIGIGEEAGFESFMPPRDAPWPQGDDSVDEIMVAYHFHRITQEERWAFMNEAWRVLIPGGKITVVSPHWSSERSYTDPLAKWPPLVVGSFMVYSAKWRQAERMTDLPLKCNLGALDPQGNPIVVYGYTRHPEIEQRNEEFRAFAQQWYVNAVFDLHVSLTKLKD